MKAAVHTKYGPPDVVQVVDVQKPKPRDNEVLVKVFATTVNRTDCAFRAAEPFIVRFFSGLFKPRATVLGCEFAGVIEVVGGQVASFEIGDSVFGFREWRFGAHAEYLSIPEDGSIATMPSGMSWREAAPSTEGSYYALALIGSAKVRGGQQVLVNGATGAIGSAAVQLLKRLNVDVTAVCAAERRPLVEGLGADRVVDYLTEDFTSGGRRYDAVIDAVGKSSFRRSRRVLKPGGIYISSELGPMFLNPMLAVVTPLLGGKKVKVPMQSRHDQALMGQLRAMIESGEFTPLIDRDYSLDQIVQAYEYVETGEKIGNVVIRVVDTTHSD